MTTTHALGGITVKSKTVLLALAGFALTLFAGTTLVFIAAFAMPPSYGVLVACGLLILTVVGAYLMGVMITRLLHDAAFQRCLEWEKRTYQLPVLLERAAAVIDGSNEALKNFHIGRSLHQGKGVNWGGTHEATVYLGNQQLVQELRDRAAGLYPMDPDAIPEERPELRAAARAMA